MKKSEHFRQVLLDQIRAQNAVKRSSLEGQYEKEREEINREHEQESQQREHLIEETCSKQAQLRKFLQLQMQVDSLRHDQDQYANVNEKLKARRTMHDLEHPARWNEMTEDEYYNSSKYSNHHHHQRPTSSSSISSQQQHQEQLRRQFRSKGIPSSKSNPSFAAAAAAGSSGSGSHLQTS